jgi:hypothetical protein
MNKHHAKILAGLLLLGHLWMGQAAHAAGLLDALRSFGDAISSLTHAHFDEFKKLVEAGKVEDAVALHSKQADYFAGLKDEKRRYVDDVLGQRDLRHRAELGEARARIVLAAREEGQLLRWQQLKAALPEAQALRTRMARIAAPGPLLKEGLQSLQTALDAVTQTLQAEAPQALLDYGLFSEPAFAAQYPIAVRWTEHPGLAAQVGAQLDTASLRQLEVFRKAHADTLIPALGVGARLNELYVSTRMRESGARTYLAKRLLRDRLAKEGWTVAEQASGILLAAWPIPPSDASTYKVAPPSSVRYQPLSAEQTPKTFIASGGAGAHELVVFLRHQPVRTERVESNTRQLNSQYQNGTRRLQNPAYVRAQEAFYSAQRQLQEVQHTVANSSATNASGSLGAFAAVIGAVSESAAEDRVDSARRTLQATPQQIEEPVLVPYTYTAKTVTLRQSVTTLYAIYDASTGKVSTGSIEHAWKKAFDVVADRVHAEDRTAAAATLVKSTRAAQDWVRAPIEDRYDDIWKTVLAAYQKNSLGI